MKPARRFLLYILPPVLWMALIFPIWNRTLGSSWIYETFVHAFRWIWPHASTHALVTAYIVWRKTGHFITYGFLAFLFYRAFRAGRPNRPGARFSAPDRRIRPRRCIRPCRCTGSGSADVRFSQR